MHRKEHLCSIDTLLSFSVKGFLKGSTSNGYIQSTSFCLTSFWASIYTFGPCSILQNWSHSLTLCCEEVVPLTFFPGNCMLCPSSCIVRTVNKSFHSHLFSQLSIFSFSHFFFWTKKSHLCFSPLLMHFCIVSLALWPFRGCQPSEMHTTE